MAAIDPISSCAYVMFIQYMTSAESYQNYTQNIDTLETLAGVQRVLQCHGSFATASCLQCHQRVPGTEIETDIMRHRVPLCTACNLPPPPEAPGKGKRSKKKSKDTWNSDVEDESDVPEYPPGIMKVCALFIRYNETSKPTLQPLARHHFLW
jgi:NAD-dependent SIR2 family protein deacetylase